ncbi:MAG: hypothetical protein A2622_07960 [Bdellovibrionales bacterium RIFCSPHIGHO2_01_FULL_40_29]|nr:MAG: hypothetical protein A2622_07960 [Bdellovibrionales bacterium RIFCSPHIGHO2_01_FULL_40_29]OFZ33038.1 MAG: hypothetical protein A3D17_07935 [Bdellovibrionales bacterium RIFCSPHIGHO2_02_FULL_40_15]
MFMNASGAWVSWLILGPLITTESKTLLAFGLMAFIRQILGFIGTRVAEKYPTSNAKKSNLIVETTLFIANVLAIGFTFYEKDIIIFWAPAWAVFRYFIGGIATIYGFQLLSRFSTKETSVIGQLAMTQGSIIVGALIAYYLMQLSPLQSLVVALSFDALTSLVFILWLIIKKIPHKEEPSTKPASLTNIVGFLFKETGAKTGSMFLLGLFILSGLPSMCLYVSLSIEKPDFFSILNLIIGVCLLFFSLIISYSMLRKINSFYFSLAVLLLSVCSYFLINSLIIFILLFILGATELLLLLHREVMSKVTQEAAVKVRVSMALQLNVIFGLGEIVCCWLITMNLFTIFVLFKTISLILFAIIHFNIRDKVKIKYAN